MWNKGKTLEPRFVIPCGYNDGKSDEGGRYRPCGRAIKVNDQPLTGRRCHLQTLARKSPDPVARYPYRGFKSTDMTIKESPLRKTIYTVATYHVPEFLCPERDNRALPCLSQNWTLRSLLPLATHCPSCERQIERT